MRSKFDIYRWWLIQTTTHFVCQQLCWHEMNLLLRFLVLSLTKYIFRLFRASCPRESSLRQLHSGPQAHLTGGHTIHVGIQCFVTEGNSAIRQQVYNLKNVFGMPKNAVQYCHIWWASPPKTRASTHSSFGENREQITIMHKFLNLIWHSMALAGLWVNPVWMWVISLSHILIYMPQSVIKS